MYRNETLHILHFAFVHLLRSLCLSTSFFLTDAEFIPLDGVPSNHFPIGQHQMNSGCFSLLLFSNKELLEFYYFYLFQNRQYIH